MTFCFNFDFIFIAYFYVAIAYVVLLFAKHIYNCPPSFASPSPDNDFYSQVKDLMNDIENQDITQQITSHTEKLEYIYPHINHNALNQAAEFLSMGLDGYSILEHLGITTPSELTPVDLNEDFCRDVVVNHFRSYCY